MKRADKPKTEHGILVSDCFRSPLWLTKRLPLVDLDPCGGPGSTVRARKQYALEYGTDGIVLPWARTIYVNFEYSRPRRWVDKFNAERDEHVRRVEQALFLVKLDPTTEWWSGIVDPDPANIDIWLFKNRLEFALIPEHFELLKAASKKAGHASSAYEDGKLNQNNFASALIHWSANRGPSRFSLDLYDVASVWRASPQQVAHVEVARAI